MTVRAKKARGDDFYVVGVGASAGGLEALSLFFAGIGADTNMAFVVIQHLSEKPKSILPEILARKTNLPLSEITGATPLLPGHVYVAPAHQSVTISKNTLNLARYSPKKNKKEEHFLPIDFFFSALAREKKEKAIGVVLSGTRKDGTEGLLAIRKKGGITFAENPEAATHPGMPESAIASGAVMHTLSPKKIAGKLSELAKLRASSLVPSVVSAEKIERETPVLDENLREIIHMLEGASNIDFSAYKEGTVRRRIVRRMNIHKMENISRYAAFLKDHPEEVRVLSEDILIHVTEFFRDSPLFLSLKRKVFPVLVRERQTSDTIRIWIPGCSTGEEVYSFAIALIEFLEHQKKNIPVQFLGTDVSEAALKEARKGQYGAEIEKKVSPERLRRFFTKIGGGAKKYEINKSIRNMCVFAKHNLVKDTPFSRIDLISCRNVLIYFDAELQKKAFPLFHFALKPKGFLVLGTSESVSGFHDLFAEADKKYKIYLRKTVVSPFRFEFSVNAHPENTKLRKEEDTFPSSRNIEKEADAIILSKHSPAGVVITRDMTILQFRGNTGAYLEPMPGRATFNLLKMVRKDFILPLTGVLDEARRTGRPSQKEVILQRETGYRKTDIEAIPLSTAGGEEKYFLVMFHEQSKGKMPAHAGRLKEKSGISGIAEEKDREIAKLREELTNTAEYLQSLIERQETTNEELRSATEEVMSSNEELQSANEELETAHEELQSTNEELTTLNTELTERNFELNEKNNAIKSAMELVEGARDYAESIFNTVSEPMLVLGKGFRVERANNAFYKNFEVSKQETEGYLFQKLGNGQWDIPEITNLLHRVLSSKTKVVNAFVEHDFPHLGKRILSLVTRRISGGASNSHEKTEKILFTIRDITKQKGLEAARAQEYGEMEEDIRDRTRKLRKVNTVLMREVVERKRLEKDLRERTKRLEEADRRKNEFLAVLSHELRNPLSPIIASVEAMKLRGTNDPEIQHAFEVIGRHADQMTRLLKDLLDASKIIYEKIELLPEYVDIREIIHHAVDTASFFVEQRNHTLTLTLPDAPKYIVVDPFRIEQILANLIFNAAKYTNPGGKIEITLLQEGERENEKLCIIIKDNGMGIVPDILPNIFDLFVQAEGVLKKTKGGIGIGLFLVRRLAELHGGTITAQSEGEDKGSKFTLCLPVKNNLSPNKEKGLPVPITNKDRTPKRILVVDDNQDAADSLAQILSHLGRTVEIAYSGKEALRKAKGTPPDMAFIDIAMPEMNGYEVAKKMRGEPSLSQTTLVALTGFGQREDKEKALREGFDLHYIKPITLSTLKDIIGG